MNQLSPCLAALAAVEALRARLDVIESKIEARSTAVAAPLSVGDVNREVIAGPNGRLDVRVTSDYWKDVTNVACFTVNELANAMLVAIATDAQKDLVHGLTELGYEDII